MNTATKVVYYGHVAVGISLIGAGVVQVFLGLRAQGITGVDGWSAYAWLGALQIAAGFGLSVSWRFYRSDRGRGTSDR